MPRHQEAAGVEPILALSTAQILEFPRALVGKVCESASVQCEECIVVSAYDEGFDADARWKLRLWNG